MKHILFCLLFSIVFAQPQATSHVKILKTTNQLDSLIAASWVAELPLTSIGPSVMSGRVTDLDVNPNATHEFYVAYASGGLWYTNNNGISFVAVMDNSPTQNIGDIAVHWPTHTIYVGTGENNASRSSYAGMGILKSTNKGNSWTQLGLADAHHIGKIEINPNNHNEVVVGVLGPLYSKSETRGIYKTMNGGQTWIKTLDLPDPTGIIELSVVPNDFNIMYAAAWEKERKAWDFSGSGAKSGIYKSTDAGNSWTLISTKESGFLQGKGVGRIGLASFDAKTIYAIVDNQDRRPQFDLSYNKLKKQDFEGISLEAFMAIDKKLIKNFLEDNGFPKEYTVDRVRDEVRNGKLKPSDLALFLYNANDDLFDTPVSGPQVFRSDDGGLTWSKTHTDFLDDVYYSYGYYFGMVHVSPVDKNHIYIYGVPILTSKDGGKSFKRLDTPNVHADHHALWINPKNPKHLLNGNDGGVNISYDGGQNWSKANQPSVGQFYTVYADTQKPYHVYGGLQDNGVWEAVHTTVESERWHQSGHNPWTGIMGGDGMQIQVDSRNANIVYTGYQFGNYFRIDRDAGERKFIQPKHKLGEAPFRFNWQTPILLSIHNNDIIYLGSNKLHRSLNQGDNWEAISKDLTKGAKKGNVPYGTLTAIDESRNSFGTIVVGSDDGIIHLTQNSGSTWRRISDKLPQNLWVSRVQFSKHNPNRIYATLNGYRWDDFSPYVYVSNDLGTSWNNISSNLPNAAVNVIREDSINKNLLYLGTDNGLYTSIDEGKNWHIFNKNIPRVAVHDLFIQESENHLLVGTHGRSIYLLALDAVQQLPELSKKTFAVLAPKVQKHSNRWGSKRSTWFDAFTPSFHWTFFAQEPSNGVWSLVSDKGVIVFEQAISFKKGLQQLPYNFTMDAAVNKQFNRKHKTDLKAADDGNLYLPKGKYIFFWNDVAHTKLVLN